MKTTTTQLVFPAYCRTARIPLPEAEHRFHPERRWRFDWAWPEHKVALEVQGGVWTGGAHVRGARLLKEWEKLNALACLGYRILYCQPKDLLKLETIAAIKLALAWRGK